MAKENKNCFVISPIGNDSSETRRRADQILKHVIKPATQECGFEAIRADEISEPGMITSQVIQHIIDDPLVIADLTGMNPNVFYELAVRHAIRKPLVQIIQKDEKLPFDVAGMRTISVDHTDLDSVEEAKKEISKQINATVKKKPEEIESPISISLELQTLRHSDKPEERSFAEFVATVTDLRSEIINIQKHISKPENLLPPNYVRDVCDLPLRRMPESKMFFNETYMRLRFIREIAMKEKKPTENYHKIIMELDKLIDDFMMLR